MLDDNDVIDPMAEIDRMRARLGRLEETTKAAQWQRPDFEQLAEKEIFDPESLLYADGSHADRVSALTAFMRRLYAMGLREAAGGAHGIANHLADPASAENLRLYAQACQDAANELDIQRKTWRHV